MNESQEPRRGLLGSKLFWVLAILLVLYLGLQIVSSTMSSQAITGVVRLVDANGQPVAGIPVEARWTSPRPFVTACSLGRSRQDGTVDLDALKDKTALFGNFELSPFIAGAKRIVITPSADGTTAAVPATCRVVVKLRDAKGGSYVDPSVENMNVRLRSKPNLVRKEFDESGQAVFEHVARNTTFTVETQLQQFSLPTMPPLHSPDSDGSNYEYQISIPESTPFVTGRIVDANGEPITDTFALAFRYANNRGNLKAWKLTTGPDGRFRFLFTTKPAGGRLTVSRAGVDRRVDVPDGDGPSFDVGTIQFEGQPSGQ